jgi:hypothetical protein
MCEVNTLADGCGRVGPRAGVTQVGVSGVDTKGDKAPRAEGKTMARFTVLSLAVASLIIGGIDSAAASTPRVTAPHIVAHPNSRMVNTSIKLIGTHFKAKSTITIKECSKAEWVVTQDVCDTTNSIVVKTNGGGRFTSSFTVQTCPEGTTSPPGFSETCYIGDPTPSGVDVIDLVGAATITVTGP